MRKIKDANERKNEILDAANELFVQKGYDTTTISDIIEKVGVARGTVYYHFKSKEEIMDALIDRIHTRLLSAAKEAASDKSVPVLERIVRIFLALSGGEDTVLLDHVHKPQNALMHQKSHLLLLQCVPTILLGSVEEGIREGIFNTPYPLETVEMVVAHVNAVFDDDYSQILTTEERLSRMKALIFNLDRLFGAEPGSFEPIMKLY